ncbi:hypothetical protein [Enterococcus sp. AZ126]|uniref:hypothetical protein n=1 Tax=Enterococcus sp. AZ126 TaxID=2774635 RepID=UPI003F25E5C2
MKKSKVAGLVVASAAVLLSLGACSEQKGEIIDEQLVNSSETADGSIQEDTYSLSEDGDFKDIEIGNKNALVIDKAKYDTDWSDTSWPGVTLSIDEAKVVQVEKYKDDQEHEYKGLLALEFKLKNDKDNKDLHIHPGQATLVLENGEEIKGEHFDDYWDDFFAKDEQKDGHVFFKFKEIDKINEIKEIHLTFDGTYGEKDKDLGTVDHLYDAKLPLELKK